MNLEDARHAARLVDRTWHAALPRPADEYVPALLPIADAGVAFAVIMDWNGREMTPPWPEELAEACSREGRSRRERQAAARRGQDRPREGQFGCLTCADTGWVLEMTEGYEGHGYAVARPCDACRPLDADYWGEGHYGKDHNPATCEHPRCKSRTEHRSRRTMFQGELR